VTDFLEIPISRQTPVLYPKLKAVEAMIEEMISYRDLHAKNEIRKRVLIHEEIERHYLQPLSRKVEKNMKGPAYDQFVAEKSRAIREFDAATRRFDSSTRSSPKSPIYRLTHRT
jgi:hypothetical protein